MLSDTMDGRQWYKTMIVLCCCLLFVVPILAKAQNLVPNPSFELTHTCPYTIGFQAGDRPLYWQSWFNSPDYFHACADTSIPGGAYVSVPQNGFSFQYAQDGLAYVGYYAFDQNDQYREYIGAVLNAPLTVGETYYISFWANIATGGLDGYVGGFCNNMGMLFTMTSNAWTNVVGQDGPDFPFRNYAHLHRSAVLTDTVGWTLVSGSFVADSAYQYVVLGNFFDNAQTQVLPIPPLNGENAYCLVDNVSVSTDPVANGIHEGPLVGQPFAAMDGVTGTLVISWPGQEQYTGEIIDMSGRVVRTFASGAGRHQVPLHRFSPGMYVVRLRKGMEAAFVRFVVAQ
ncbi:MAG TPA: T9SS type A sorting domain-containing protein [Flavobacteriales bacterium]|nr:T9SS type A sorting domain-containing protein [Flavobacteriales bacterium]HNU57444.1 T9SS type A sorting domain-containing protein [Flavobacteriales bacterium]